MGPPGPWRQPRRLLAVALLGSAGGALAQAARGRVAGILAEYFVGLGPACDPQNGSTSILDTLLPNITRTDAALEFQSAKKFAIDRCFFEASPKTADMRYVCRGGDGLSDNFAVRWTGYLQVQTAGTYTFQMQADDGARFIMGHDNCPGYSCGVRAMVQNLHWGYLPPTAQKGEQTYAQNCRACDAGVTGECFITYAGCEPFPLWWWEADGGRNGTCGMGATSRTAQRSLLPGLHPFKIEYFQRRGTASFSLKWSGPDNGDTMASIPTSAFVFPTGKGLQAEWYAVPYLPTRLPPAQELGTVFKDARLIRRVDDGFLDTAPRYSQFSKDVASIKVGCVYVRWTGFLQIVTGGTYTFRLLSDDGSRLVFGARGAGGEQVVVDNDGVKAEPQSVTGQVDMLPGLTPLRLEFFSSPGAPGSAGDLGTPQPPGVQLFYSGPDTGNTEVSISRSDSDFLQRSDVECPLSNWAWGNGMLEERDCSGACYRGMEAALGDYICDDGRLTGGVLKEANYYCSAFAFDNGDCQPPDPVQFTTPRPPNPCMVSCPPGNWSRRNCRQCPRSKDGYCVEDGVKDCIPGPRDPPGICNYGRCCVAQLFDQEYWGSDCISFGAYSNCSSTLQGILQDMNSATRSTAELATKPQKVPTTGQLMVDCTGSYCNPIPNTFVRSPFTGVLTNERVCKEKESAKPGQQCFMGPWPDTDMNPLVNCENGTFQWNFCVNRKTVDGRPFTRCCAFLYIDYRGMPQCRFVGIESGTCKSYLAVLKVQLSDDPFTVLSQEQVINDCTSGDLCNLPTDIQVGCPDVVVKRPKQVASLLPPEDVDHNALVNGGEEQHKDGPPYLSIFLPLGCVILILVTAYFIRQALKEKPKSPWHSRKAKVIGDDTFVEPEQDFSHHAALGTVNFGVVKPRPLALTMIIDEARGQAKPKALRLESTLTTAEVAQMAYQTRVAIEAEVEGVDVGTMRALMEARGEGLTTVKVMQEKFATRALGIELPGPDSLAAELAALKAAEAEAPLESARSSTSPSTKEVPLALEGPGLPGQIVEFTAYGAEFASSSDSTAQLALPAPPMDEHSMRAEDAAEIAFYQADALPPAPQGCVNVVGALVASATVGTVPVPPVSAPGRPPAAARFLRKGMSSNGPRVAT